MLPKSLKKKKWSSSQLLKFLMFSKPRMNLSISEGANEPDKEPEYNDELAWPYLSSRLNEPTEFVAAVSGIGFKNSFESWFVKSNPQ